MRSSGRRAACTRSRARGITLFEMLVAATLTLTLLTMLFWFMIPALHAYLRGTARAGLQQSAMIAMTRMVADLQATTPLSTSCATDPTVLGMCRLRDVTDTGAQVWESKVIVYAFAQATHTLWRIECPPPPPALAPVTLTIQPGQPYRPTPSDLRAIAAGGGGVALATDVEAFEVSAVDPNDGHEIDATVSTTDPLVLTLRMARKEAHQEEPERFVLRRVVSLRQRL